MPQQSVLEKQKLVAQIFKLCKFAKAGKWDDHSHLKQSILSMYGDRRCVTRMSKLPTWLIYKYMHFPKQAVTQCKINALYNRSFVEEFFALEDVAVQCPETRKAGNLYCRKMLWLLYPQYCVFMKNKTRCLEVADVLLWLHKHCVKLSTFYSYRPKHVTTSNKIPPWMCVCEKCENVKMPQKAIQKAGIKEVLQTLVKCLRATWCKYKDSRLPSVTCAKHWCPHCGVHRLRQCIMEATTAPNWKVTVKYRQWQQIECRQ